MINRIMRFSKMFRMKTDVNNTVIVAVHNGGLHGGVVRKNNSTGLHELSLNTGNTLTMMEDLNESLAELKEFGYTISYPHNNSFSTRSEYSFLTIQGYVILALISFVLSNQMDYWVFKLIHILVAAFYMTLGFIEFYKQSNVNF